MGGGGFLRARSEACAEAKAHRRALREGKERGPGNPWLRPLALLEIPLRDGHTRRLAVSLR